MSHNCDSPSVRIACELAPFGRNGQTVLDESHPKAGKMEVDDFMVRFDAERAGLTEVVRTFLFSGAGGEKFLKAELYKLNVYGKDAFFKPHAYRYTARQEHARLARGRAPPLPTKVAHSSSATTSTSGHFESTSGALLSEPRAAFASFFSDTEHKVAPVKPGHRLTIMYNLYCSPTRTGRPPAPRREHVDRLERARRTPRRPKHPPGRRHARLRAAAPVPGPQILDPRGQQPPQGAAGLADGRLTASLL
ncbi:hypothetical protein LXA43DRAFT_1098011 [Ganoderma leucocontextum]|nr:hypothetical protein LXA43DRAFT_1098011 [Ganoderma leucocontextum]